MKTFILSEPRLLLFGFFISFFAGFGQTFFISIFNLEIRSLLNLSDGQFGLVYSLATLTSDNAKFEAISSVSLKDPLPTLTSKIKLFKPEAIFFESIEDVKILMRWHVFAVWDFMSLLKGLQREVTCVETPWIPSKYDKECVRFINEIVLGEESDEDLNGGHIDHFTMYLNAMNEVGSETSDIEKFLETFSFDGIPMPVAKFSAFNLNLCTNTQNPHLMASAFFWGRENLIPDLFTPFVKVLEEKKMFTNALYFSLKFL